jgi:N-acetylneuraminic acid mutarotase
VRPIAVALAVLCAGAFIGALASAGGATTPAAGWERAASLSQRRSYAAAATIGGRIYVAGGMVGETGRPLATVSRYDPRRDAWTTLAPLPTPTRSAAGTAFDGRFVVAGGTTAAGNVATVVALDPRGGGWRRLASLPAPRFNHRLVALGGRLYALGGYDAGRERRDVYVYEPAANSWLRGTPLPRPVHAFGAVAFHGELWIVGGRRGEQVLREVWILDPRTGRWRAGPALPKPMELLGLAVDGDRLHAVEESTYQVYDASNGRWRIGPSPGVRRHALEAFAVAGSLYAVGGCTTALRDSPVVERLRLA